MSMVAYTVWAAFDDPRVLQAFRDWLQREHIGQVIEAGAVQADLLQHAPSESAPGGSLEVRYLFASAEALEIYREHHMPGLRARTQRQFSGTPGIRYERIEAPVVARFGVSGRS
ncbi:MAG: hypothetical protein Kow0022_04050 [Phycisphaerales bacterium]